MDKRGLVGGDTDHRLVELHLDQASLGAELDDVALDLTGHPSHELGALEHRQHVVEGRAPLELERRESRRDLIEARLRYLSSVASAWLALASTTGMSSRMYLTPST